MNVNQLTTIACIVSVALVLLGLWLRNRALNRARWAGYDAENARKREAARIEHDRNLQKSLADDEVRRLDDVRRWDQYEAAAAVVEATLRAEGPPAAWKVRQDQETGKWLLMRPYLDTPLALRHIGRAPPSLSEFAWSWHTTRGVFDTLEDAQAFARIGPEVGQSNYLLNAQGDIIKIEPACDPDDDENEDV